MGSRRSEARQRLIQSLGESVPSSASPTDRELALETYRALLSSISAQSELADTDAAMSVVTSEVSRMRAEKKHRSNIAATS